MPVELTSTAVERDDLRRVRILTILRLPETSATSVHVAGKIRLIGLEEVKQALGSRWEAVAMRALASAEHVIRRRCGGRDTWSRTADGGFLICFADATEEEAAFRAAAMAREIRIPAHRSPRPGKSGCNTVRAQLEQVSKPFAQRVEAANAEAINREAEVHKAITDHARCKHTADDNRRDLLEPADAALVRCAARGTRSPTRQR